MGHFDICVLENVFFDSFRYVFRIVIQKGDEEGDNEDENATEKFIDDKEMIKQFIDEFEILRDNVPMKSYDEKDILNTHWKPCVGSKCSPKSVMVGNMIGNLSPTRVFVCSRVFHREDSAYTVGPW